MNVLVLNCGSSSVKFQLVETDLERMKAFDEPVLAKGGISKIGLSEAVVDYAPSGREPIQEIEPILDHQTAVSRIIHLLTNAETGVVSGLEGIHAVGHRIVHGGEHFARSAVFDADVAAKIRECVTLAPLHNPHNLRGYQMASQVLPDIPHVAVFDTAFHQTMEPHVYLYGLPYVLYQRHRIRRYGFHGTSHRFICSRLRRLVPDKEREHFKFITIHLGNGCSMAAIQDGCSIDTSMGFTPLEGLLMGTRTGDMDPAVILHLMACEEIGMNEANTLMNKHSGLQGVSGVSNDMRDIVNAAIEDNNERAGIALDMFCYRVKKYIGAYIAALNGADAVAFTGGIGENSEEARRRICADMDWLGISLDEERNVSRSGKESLISSDDSRVQVWIVPTNEELVIARDTVRCVEQPGVRREYCS
jgi:acetate kinase